MLMCAYLMGAGKREDIYGKVREAEKKVEVKVSNLPYARDNTKKYKYLGNFCIVIENQRVYR